MTTATVKQASRRKQATSDVAGTRTEPLTARTSVAAIASIVLVGGVVPIMIARHFGAFGIPRGDDVAYILSAFRFADTGKINGNNWPSMNLFGQLVMSAPVIWTFGHR